MAGFADLMRAMTGPFYLKMELVIHVKTTRNQTRPREIAFQTNAMPGNSSK